MNENTRVGKFVVGNVTGLAADKILRDVKPTMTQSNPLSYVEHFHIGIGSYIAHKITGSSFAHGLATSLFILEAIEENPFGIGKDPVSATFNVYITTALLGILGIVEAAKKT